MIPHYIEYFQERFVNALLVKQFNNNYLQKDGLKLGEFVKNVIQLGKHFKNFI